MALSDRLAWYPTAFETAAFFRAPFLGVDALSAFAEDYLAADFDRRERNRVRKHQQGQSLWLRSSAGYGSFRVAYYESAGIQAVNWSSGQPAARERSVVEELVRRPGLVCAWSGAFDDWFWQNQRSTDTYTGRGRSFAGLPLVPSPTGGFEVDISGNPGRSTEIRPHVWMRSAWRMWLGAEALAALKPGLTPELPDVERAELFDGVLFVELYEDPMGFDRLESRERQRRFRERAGLDTVIVPELVALARAAPAPPVAEGTPMGFGYKGSWYAVRSTDGASVASAVGLVDVEPTPWEVGIARAHALGNEVRVTPPVDGWVFVIGAVALAFDDRASVDATRARLEPLSASFGEAHAFTSNRIVDVYGWILCRGGSVERVYAECLENGFVVDEGTPLAVEPVERPAVREDDVIRVAGSVSLNPTTLAARGSVAGRPLLGRLG